MMRALDLRWLRYLFELVPRLLCWDYTQDAEEMSEYVCDECTTAKQGTETYCHLPTTVRRGQVLTGCEKVSDWYGRCVGILQSEGHIEEYEVPQL